MYNVKVYFKNKPIECIFEFESKLDLNLNDMNILVKSLLGTYCYQVTIGSTIPLSETFRIGFDISNDILSEYNIQKPDLSHIDDLFNVFITPITLPNTVEEMFK